MAMTDLTLEERAAIHAAVSNGIAAGLHIESSEWDEALFHAGRAYERERLANTVGSSVETACLNQGLAVVDAEMIDEAVEDAVRASHD